MTRSAATAFQQQDFAAALLDLSLIHI